MATPTAIDLTCKNLTELAYDPLAIIASHLDTQSLSNLAQVCKHFTKMSPNSNNDPLIWTISRMREEIGGKARLWKYTTPYHKRKILKYTKQAIIKCNKESGEEGSKDFFNASIREYMNLWQVTKQNPENPMKEYTTLPSSGYFDSDPFLGAIIARDNELLSTHKEHLKGIHLSYAIRHRNLEIIKLLSTHVTPIPIHLSIAIRTKNLNIIQLLLEHGATPTTGHLSYAIRHRNLEIIQLLLKHGAIPTKRQLEIALKGSNSKIANLLKSKM